MLIQPATTGAGSASSAPLSKALRSGTTRLFVLRRRGMIVACAPAVFFELTSRPARKAANALYRSLGFSLHKTNVYALDLQAM